MDGFARWRISVVKGADGVAVGGERFIPKNDPLFKVVTEELNTNVITFFSRYISGEEATLGDGYRLAIRTIDELTEVGSPLLIGIPQPFFKPRFNRKLKNKVPCRLVRLRGIPARHAKTEETLAIDALRNKTNTEEVLWNEEV